MKTFVIEAVTHHLYDWSESTETFVVVISDPVFDTANKVLAEIRRQLKEADFVVFEDQTIQSYSMACGDSIQVHDLEDWANMKCNSLKLKV